MFAQLGPRAKLGPLEEDPRAGAGARLEQALESAAGAEVCGAFNHVPAIISATSGDRFSYTYFALKVLGIARLDV